MSRLLVASAFLAAVSAAVVSVALTVGSASAGGPPVRIGPGDLPPDVFTAINPCTGLEHEITISPTAGLIHEFESPGGPNGGHHLVMTLRGASITTSDGFSAATASPFVLVDNGAGPFGDPEDRGVFTQTINQMLTNSDGDRIRAHLNFHLTVVDGAPVVVVENFVVECVGNSG